LAGFGGVSSFLGAGAFSFFSAGFTDGVEAPIFRTLAGPVDFEVGVTETFPAIGALGGGKLGNPLPVFFSSMKLASGLIMDVPGFLAVCAGGFWFLCSS